MFWIRCFAKDELSGNPNFLRSFVGGSIFCIECVYCDFHWLFRHGKNRAMISNAFQGFRVLHKKCGGARHSVRAVLLQLSGAHGVTRPNSAIVCQRHRSKKTPQNIRNPILPITVKRAEARAPGGILRSLRSFAAIVSVDLL